jgi:hypothetical protein
MGLATTQKGTSSVVEYIAKMKVLADDMASAGKKFDDEELCSYILVGLDFKYNSFVSSIAARVEPISFSELYSQLLAFENRLELQGDGHSQSSVNAATRGRGGFQRGRSGRGFPGHPSSPGCQSSGGRGRGSGDSSNKPQNKFPPCQICGKQNHSVFKCFKRFDPSYMGEKSANYAASSTQSYGLDTNWYADSGATDHVTNNLDKLAVRDAYSGDDQIYTAGGSGMHIAHVGNFVIPTPRCHLKLTNVLHVPQASKI